jgi:hypothetical protein
MINSKEHIICQAKISTYKNIDSKNDNNRACCKTSVLQQQPLKKAVL